MALPSSISVTFPSREWQTVTGYDKIAVIKAIRSISGLGLKEAKDASECGECRILPVSMPTWSDEDEDKKKYLHEQRRILEINGCTLGPSVRDILQSLRELGSAALVQGEDELANEILQLVLAERLRRNHETTYT